MRTIKEQLQRLRKLDPSTVTDVEASRLMDEAGQGYIYRAGRAFLPTCYRVRLNEETALFSHKDELWANPNPRIGRFNRAGMPVLYISSTPIGAMWEMRPQSGQRYTLLACAQQRDSPLIRNVAIGAERFNPTPMTGPLAEHMKDGVRGSPGFMDELKSRGILDEWMLQDDFFSDLATEWFPPGTENDHYKLTNPLWEALAGSDPEVDALMYPSVQHNLHAFNMAVKLEAAQEIKPREAWALDIHEIVDRANLGERDFFATITHRGEVLDDGSISWIEGRWGLDEVRADFRRKVGCPPDLADAPPILKYSEEQIAARNGYAQYQARFRGYTWKG